jgi:hypothetical protein
VNERVRPDGFDWDSLPPAVPWTSDARELWPTEIDHLTPWVIANLDMIGKKAGLGLSPTTARREVQLGQFYADIVVCDQRGRAVVIENQLGPSDHDHFARLMIYACEASADVVIWVVAGAGGRFRSSEPIRPEHQRALAKLNAKFVGDVSFYAVAIDLEHNGQSGADGLWQPLLRLVVAPIEPISAIGGP